jgi:hypothetical protein
MSASVAKYRAPFLTQRGLDSTLDDCSVVAALHGIAFATLGEFTTTAQGREMGKAQLQALARRMRRSLGVDDASGGLSNADQIEMVKKQGFPAPRLLNISFIQARANMKERSAVYSIGGNPARIVGPSPLKRCDCAHEWLIAFDPTACDADELLIYDGLRPASTIQRGEVRPASEVRQMCFKDSDGDLSGVLEFPIGAWTAEARTEATLRRNLGNLRSERDALADAVVRQRERNSALKAENATLTTQNVGLAQALEECESNPQNENAKAAGWEAFGNAAQAAIVDLLNEGPP